MVDEVVLVGVGFRLSPSRQPSQSKGTTMSQRRARFGRRSTAQLYTAQAPSAMPGSAPGAGKTALGEAADARVLHPAPSRHKSGP